MAVMGARHTNNESRDAEESLNDRIKMYEGTASDLLAIPVLGSSCCSCVVASEWRSGYATISLDYRCSGVRGRWRQARRSRASGIINHLVLAFFRERALKNVAPLISKILADRKRG
jgi:hypothetical protein